MKEKSKVVLVTGAGKRIGKAIALGFAQAGWRVAIHYHTSEESAKNTAQECNRHTYGCIIFEANLACESAALDLVNRVVEKMGRIDALINSASLFRLDEVATFTYAKLQEHVAVNVAAPICLAKTLYDHIVQRHTQEQACSGVVVNLLDQKLWNLNVDFFSYTLSKSALETANTLMAREFAPHLRVVGVAPGTTLDGVMPYSLEGKTFDVYAKYLPLRRQTNIQDLVDAVLFSANNQSITGTTILLDSGQHLPADKHEPGIALLKEKLIGSTQ